MFTQNPNPESRYPSIKAFSINAGFQNRGTCSVEPVVRPIICHEGPPISKTNPISHDVPCFDIVSLGLAPGIQDFDKQHATVLKAAGRVLGAVDSQARRNFFPHKGPGEKPQLTRRAAGLGCWLKRRQILPCLWKSR